MQLPIVCVHCNTVIPAAVPELTREVWHTDCPACGRVTVLKAILGDPEELPSFSATAARLVRSPLSEPKQ